MDRAVAANTDGEILSVHLSAADQLFCVLFMCCEPGALRSLERTRDTEGASVRRWLVKEHAPDTAGRHASVLLQILSYTFTDETRMTFDTLDLLVQKYEPSTSAPLAVPLKVALVQKGVKHTDVLNHLVMHASRLSTNALVCEEVRSLMLTRATLMNTAQQVDIGALDKQKGKEKGRSKKGDKEKSKQPKNKSRCCLPSTHGPTTLSAE